MVEFFFPGVVARPGVALLAYAQIRDTAAHTYRNTSGIFIRKIGAQVPPVRGAAIWVYNAEDQAATVQVIGNIAANGQFPDFAVGSAVTVGAGSAAWIQLSPPYYEFVSLQIAYSAAPSTGYIVALLYTYH